jgi:hypothetical protein
MSKKQEYPTADGSTLSLTRCLVEKVLMSDLRDEYDLPPFWAGVNRFNPQNRQIRNI